MFEIRDRSLRREPILDLAVKVSEQTILVLIGPDLALVPSTVPICLCPRRKHCVCHCQQDSSARHKSLRALLPSAALNSFIRCKKLLCSLRAFETDKIICLDARSFKDLLSRTPKRQCDVGLCHIGMNRSGQRTKQLRDRKST